VINALLNRQLIIIIDICSIKKRHSRNHNFLEGESSVTISICCFEAIHEISPEAGYRCKIF